MNSPARNKSWRCTACGLPIANPLFLGNEMSDRAVPIHESCFRQPALREAALQPFAEIMEARRQAWDGPSQGQRAKLKGRAANHKKANNRGPERMPGV